MQRVDRLTESQLASVIHSAGMRPSVQRIAILGYIANDRLHPTADEIHAHLLPKYPSLSPTTVYNTLHAMIAVGLVREIEIDGIIRRYDVAQRLRQPHSHFKCVGCGRIFDMVLPSGLDAAAEPGFQVDSVDLYFKGVCPDCREQ